MALAEAVNKLGQAPSRPLIFQGFRRFLSEPVPFFHSLALWRQHAWSPRIRELGRLMEAELWREIATFYHADMKNLCGPFVRANGMDMTQYFALTGLWIALVVGDPARTPIPTSRAPHGERIFGPVFARLQPRVPEDVLPHLRGFAGPRRFERTFGQSEATVLIEKDFMMGAAALPRRWEQHHPATIHWLIRPGQHVGWILLTGLNNDVAPRGANRSLEIRRVSESNAMVRFLVSAPGLDEAAITRDEWHLPGLRMAVEQAAGARAAAGARMIAASRSGFQDMAVAGHVCRNWPASNRRSMPLPRPSRPRQANTEPRSTSHFAGI
jgi:hypothetical protein